MGTFVTVLEKFRHSKRVTFAIDDVLLFDNAQNGDLDTYSKLFERHIDSILVAYQYECYQMVFLFYQRLMVCYYGRLYFGKNVIRLFSFDSSSESNAFGFLSMICTYFRSMFGVASHI